MATNLEKLRGLLQELFQLDQADLDFGIYRIMNQKRDEVVRFLDKDLLPQVQSAFKHYKSADKSVLQGELDKLVENITNAGMNPDESPKVKELRQQLAGSTVDVTALENEVFSHLFNFFRRYYSEGDFISLRRYKEGVYAIPYEGEEVKLHWANADQYYVKSSETFRDYTFMVAGGKRVRVHLVAASTEQDNNKAAPGTERRFVLADMPLSEENGELFIRFEYRPHDGKEKQDDLNKQAIDAVLKTPGFEQWSQELGKLAPTDKKRDRTVLEKHLYQYTARNTFDYFIHKDLGGFLRRELDFYIKNEVMHLDDIEHESVPKVEQYLSQIKVIRSIAHKIIQFLEQLENFQKKLWLKKKFVIETNYCITLDRVPEELYPEIAKNDAQREEWVKLLAIDETERVLNEPKYSVPLTVAFLNANPHLMIDTAHFRSNGDSTDGFVTRLLALTTSLDDTIEGVLVRSDNYQALRLISARYHRAVDCIYIDPPYNTDASAILYKNDYKDSSWMSLMFDRLRLASHLLTQDGVLCAAIDDVEVTHLRHILASLFPKEIGIAVVRANPQSRKTKGKFSPVHEYALFYGNSPESLPGSLDATEKKKDRYPYTDSKGRYAWMNFIRTGNNDLRSDRPKLYYPIFVANDDTIRIPNMEWSPKANEYLLLERPRNGESVVYPVSEKNGTRTEKNWHRGHNRVLEDSDDYRVRRVEDGKISIDFKTRMDEAATPNTWWDKTEYASANYGAAELKELFGVKPFDFPKAHNLVEDCLRASGATETGSMVLDFFGGSGTTAHAIIDMIRNDNEVRKYVLVESGHHFSDVIVPRIKKAVYSGKWKDGKPTSTDGISHAVKYLRLESYEDALNNLELKRSEQQEMFLDADPEMREQYMLSYTLDVESRGSLSLLDIGSFHNPNDYKMQIERNGETQLLNVDLVETFNWLLGLTVKHIDVIPLKKGGPTVRVVEGTSPNGDRVLVLWRNIDQMDNDALDKWFEKQDYNTREMVYDVFYVNGDNNLENLRRPDQTWKVRLIEEEFQRLMCCSTGNGGI